MDYKYIIFTGVTTNQIVIRVTSDKHFRTRKINWVYLRFAFHIILQETNPAGFFISVFFVLWV